MAIAFVKNVGSNNGAGGATAAYGINYSAVPAVGNTVLVAVSIDTANPVVSIVDQAGNTFSRDGAQNTVGPGTEIWRGKIINAVTTSTQIVTTFTSAAAAPAVSAAEFTGFVAATAVDVVRSGGSTSGTALSTAATGALFGTGEYVVALFATGGQTAAPTPAGGYTTLASQGSIVAATTHIFEGEAAPSAATLTPTATGAASTAWSGICVVYAPTGTGGYVAPTGSGAPTAAKLPNTAVSGGTGTAWTNPANAKSSSDSGAVATTTATGLTASGNLDLTVFNLLTEEGGTIPTAATIISAVVTFRLSGSNPNQLAGGAGSIIYTLFKAAGATSVATNNVAIANGGTQALADFTLSFTGTNAAPQTAITRSDLSNTNLLARVNATCAGTLNTLTANCDYVTVVVNWTVFVQKTGGPASSGSSSSTKKITVSKALTMQSDATPLAARTALRVVAATNQSQGDISSPHSIVRSASATNQARPSLLASRAATVAKAGTNQSQGDTTTAKVVRVAKALVMQADASILAARTATRTVAGTNQSQGDFSSPHSILRAAAGIFQSAGATLGAKNVIVSKLGTAQSAGATSASKIVRVTKAGTNQAAGVLSATRAALLAKSATNQSAGATSASKSVIVGKYTIIASDGLLVGARAATVSKAGTNQSDATISAIRRLFAYGLTGNVYNSTGTSTIAGASVYVFRTSDMTLVASLTTDAVGHWAAVLPNDAQTYYVRGHYTGTPHMVDTTDQEIPVVSSQVQGPP
jgi:hypothetical protein